MALAVNSEMASSAGFNSAGSPFTYSFNNAAGTLLVVGVLVTGTSGSAAAISAVTYGGTAMTAVSGASVTWDSGGVSANLLKFYYLLSPLTGSNTVSITWTDPPAPVDAISGAISFTGNDSVTPIRSTAFTNTALTGTTASVVVTGTTTGNIVVDISGCGASAGFSGRTNTLSWAKNVSGSTGGDNAESTRAAGTGGSVTMSHTVSASDSWGVVAIEVQAGGSGAPSIGFGHPLAPNMVGGKPGPVNQFRSTKAYLVPDPPAVPTFWYLQSPAQRFGSGPVGRIRPRLPYVVPAGGAIQYTQAVDGTLTSSGLLLKLTATSFAGSFTSSGLLVKQTGKILVGGLTSSGAIQKQTGKVAAGTLTSSGGLVKQTGKIEAGTLTSSGSLVKQTGKFLSGVLTSAGLLVKQTNKILAGTLTSSGALTAFKVALVALAGTLTSSGALVIQTRKNLAGTLTSAGSLVKRTAISMSGTLTSAGALLASKVTTAVRKVYIFLFDD
jgi:hypothetical protein